MIKILRGQPTSMLVLWQSEALLAQGCLSAAGIESFLTDANIARLEWPLSRGMRLQVSADDAESAIELLDQPADDTYS
jgi:hypothetical protein